MTQGREAILRLVEGKASWPPVVVVFGLDPWGWHGAQPSYRDVCSYALDKCAFLPKVYPFTSPLFIGGGDVRVTTATRVEPDGTEVHRSELTGSAAGLYHEEVRTPGDSSWKARSRWIETGSDLDRFLALDGLQPSLPDLDAVRKKERQAGSHGLPYIEIFDPFYTVCEMFPTDMFFILLRTDTEKIVRLIEATGRRILHGVEVLCRDAGCPFIPRFIGAEMAVPPFLSAEDFNRFLGPFYREAAAVTGRYGLPAAFHCHGPVRDIIDTVWDMGYAFMEPFEPPPRGNMTIAEALAATDGRGIVFGGLDEVVFNTGTTADVREAVGQCLDDARGSGRPFILSQTATPFHDPLGDAARENLMLFIELGTAG